MSIFEAGFDQLALIFVLTKHLHVDILSHYVSERRNWTPQVSFAFFYGFVFATSMSMISLLATSLLSFVRLW